MIKIYFDDVLLSQDDYVNYTQVHEMFLKDLSFVLGSTPSREVKISVYKESTITAPQNVKVTYDDVDLCHLVVDSIAESKFTYDYNLKDLMVLFEFRYSAQEIISQSVGKSVSTLEIFEDICAKANVETDVTSFLNDDLEVNYYDNRINGREYIGMLAELNAGYAYITNDGKLDFARFATTTVETIEEDNCDDVIIGETHTITRTVFDSGINIIEFGEPSGDTLYLYSSNVFITSQQIVSDIHDVIVDLTFTTMKIPNTVITDYGFNLMERFNITVGTNTYGVFAQPKFNYNGGFFGGYTFECKTKFEQETRDIGVSDQIRNIEVEIDRTNNLVSTTITETGKNTTNISTLTQDVNSLVFAQTLEGGDNLIYNSNKIIVDEIDDYWTFSGGYDGYTTESTLTRSRRIQYIGSGWEQTSQIIPNGLTCVNFYYKHLLGVGTAFVTINGKEFDLADESEWTRFEYNGFETTSNSITIRFTGDTLNAFAYYDLMVNSGTESKLYDQNEDEIRAGSTTIGGKSVSVTSTTTNTKISMNAEEGFYIDNTLTDNRAVLGTTSGLETIFVSADTGEIANLRFSKRSSGTALTYIDEV